MAKWSSLQVTLWQGNTRARLTPGRRALTAIDGLFPSKPCIEQKNERERGCGWSDYLKPWRSVPASHNLRTRQNRTTVSDEYSNVNALFSVVDPIIFQDAAGWNRGVLSACPLQSCSAGGSDDLQTTFHNRSTITSLAVVCVARTDDMSRPLFCSSFRTGSRLLFLVSCARWYESEPPMAHALPAECRLVIDQDCATQQHSHECELADLSNAQRETIYTC